MWLLLTESIFEEALVEMKLPLAAEYRSNEKVRTSEDDYEIIFSSFIEVVI